MAYLTREELTRLVVLLAEEMGLARLHAELVRLHGLVTRRRANSAEQLAARLYTLTSGFRRPGPASAALQAVWSRQLGEKIDGELEKEIEKLAGEVNECVDDRGKILPDRRDELDRRLGRYEQKLASLVGAERARLDTLIKAYPEVAERLRAMPLPAASSAESPAAPQGGGASSAS